MHMIGTPGTMQQQPQYDDVVQEVRHYFENRLRALEREGIDPARIALDPGFGFGKTLDHNVALMRALPELMVDGRPLLIGVSRKSMIARLVKSDNLEDRDWPTVALTSYARSLGARLVRVHDVKPNVQAMRMTEAIQKLPV
jgi:dihydropteroate synthase